MDKKGELPNDHAIHGLSLTGFPQIEDLVHLGVFLDPVELLPLVVYKNSGLNLMVHDSSLF